MTRNSAVCTLFEGDYHYGVAALANSLFRFGYRGIIHVGYRGPLPDWAKLPGNSTHSTLKLVEGLSFRFHLLETPWHLANYKSQFINTVFDSDSSIEAVFYFDPDIVIKCLWSYFEEWVQVGIALVEEIATRGMAYNHPIRKQWLEVAKELKIVCHPTYSQYFNSGFVGIHRSCQHFLDDWTAIMSSLPKHGINLSGWMPCPRPHPFCGPDQDALNIIAMAAEPYLSTIGPEGMDFIPGGFTMSHAVGSPKPWRKRYLLSAVNGIKPSLADKAFWDNVTSPIQVFPKSLIFRRRKLIRFASLIGRFYRQ